jgi:hypothetical protein
MTCIRTSSLLTCHNRYLFQQPPRARAAELPRDPHATAALVKIATVFNDEYDGGDYRPVYDRWMRAAR